MLRLLIFSPARQRLVHWCTLGQPIGLRQHLVRFFLLLRGLGFCLMGLGPYGLAYGQPLTLSEAPHALPQPAQAALAKNAFSLTLNQAKAYAVAHQTTVLLALEQLNESADRAREVRAGLLPSMEFKTYQIRQTENLKAIGISLPGLPVVIGPFDTFDARVRLTQRVFDLTQIYSVQAANDAVEATRWRTLATEQQVAGAAALAYVELLRSRASVVAAQANQTLAQRLLQLARDQQGAGLSTGVDVVRAENALARNALYLRQARQLESSADTRLHRALGIEMQTTLLLTDSLEVAAGEVASTPPEAQSIEQALESRPELQALQQVVSQRRQERRAALAENVPAFSLSGDLGSSGVNPTHYDYRTYSYGIQMTLPLAQGGAMNAREDAAHSRERQAELALQDTRQQVEEDVRLALISVQTSQEQMQTAQTGLTLALRLEEQAQDRFSSGVADNLELVDAQTNLASARSTWIDAEAAWRMARINLDLALGRLDYATP